jgi:uncharacterized protein with HEPN domain
MPSSDYLERLRHVRDTIETLRGFVAGSSLDAFLADEKLRYAVVRALEIVSEATRHIPEAIKRRYPHLDWRQVADAGNIYRHVYDQLDWPRVWRTATESTVPLYDMAIAELGDRDA